VSKEVARAQTKFTIKFTKIPMNDPKLLSLAASIIVVMYQLNKHPFVFEKPSSLRKRNTIPVVSLFSTTLWVICAYQ